MKTILFALIAFVVVSCSSNGEYISGVGGSAGGDLAPSALPYGVRMKWNGSMKNIQTNVTYADSFDFVLNGGGTIDDGYFSGYYTYNKTGANTASLSVNIGVGEPTRYRSFTINVVLTYTKPNEFLVSGTQVVNVNNYYTSDEILKYTITSRGYTSL